METIFHPLTIGYDWEMAVLKQTMESAGEKAIVRLANELRTLLPWSRIGIDLDLLEARLGIIRDWEELLGKNQTFFRVAKKLARKRNFLIFPLGARPTEQMPIGSHIHVGTVYDYPTAVALANRMTKYVPCFVALMCNSPLSRFEVGEYKSYRVAHDAEWCSSPQPLHHPRFARPGWGEDTSVKIPFKPTIELRCGDSTSDPKLMCECTVLAAGVMYGLSHNLEVDAFECNPDEFFWNSVNRWRAAKYGLQAIFHWDRGERPVTEILKEMLNLAEEGINLLGAEFKDLITIAKMIEKRQTQADFILTLYELEKDPHRLLRTMATIFQDEGAFGKWLDIAPVLPPIVPMDIKDHILSKITIGSRIGELSLFSPLSPWDLDKVLEELEKDGLIKVQYDPIWGKMYTSLRQGRRGG